MWVEGQTTRVATKSASGVSYDGQNGAMWGAGRGWLVDAAARRLVVSSGVHDVVECLRNQAIRQD